MPGAFSEKMADLVPPLEAGASLPQPTSEAMTAMELSLSCAAHDEANILWAIG